MLGKLISSFQRWLADEPAVQRAAPAATEAVSGSAPVFPSAGQAGTAPALPAGTAPEAGEPVLVHREVLDEQLDIRGVEFFIRGELRDKLNTQRSSMRRFLDSMLVDQLASLRHAPMRHRQIWLQLSDTSLQRLGTGKLPARTCVLLSCETPFSPAPAETREALAVLHEAGHEVWLDDAIGTPWFSSLAEQADGAMLRLALRTPFEADELLRMAREARPGLRLGAWDVNTPEDFDLARRLRCTRFSGSFVTRREDWSGRELSPQMLTVASLINQIREELNYREVARVLKQDMAMSYRLLRYVNAAAHGLTQRISGIEQALMILGQEQLDRWLTLLLLSGGAMGDSAITEIALTRARFLELCAAGRLSAEQCDKLFVLGLFSMLDVALKVPLEAAIRPLRLADTMNAALLAREGLFGTYLSLADACERGVASEIIRHAVQLGLTSSKVSSRRIEAINWVADIASQPEQRVA
ncbi:EAL and HDOD domain-containing protein [Uliginosibacterium paludis]|uniref:HDOD domain-containing protein n=1 Tax=Uliginosibacterium paludis TaxID=1615952 RepID=A0ABV2CTD4_9RHOO